MQNVHIHGEQPLIHCPNCGSDHVSKLSLAYRRRLPALEGSVTRSAYVTATVPHDNALTRDPHAQDLAPPRKASYLSILLVALGFVLFAVLLGVTRWFLTIWISGWVIAVLVLWFGAYRHNTEQWPKKMSTWKQSHLCYDCGERFIPTNVDEAS